MNQHHIDNRVNDDITKLIDSLCMFERNTDRGSLLIIIPAEKDEDIVAARDGKPLKAFGRAEIAQLIEVFLMGR
jgi:hypothetical protein